MNKKQKRMTPGEFNGIIVNVSDRIQKDKNVEFNFYDNETLMPYFSDYVRIIKQNKKLTDEECVKLLNNDLKRSLTANMLRNTDRNVKQSYINFLSVVASVQNSLKEKYGVENYNDLAFSKNKEAKKEFEALEKFAIEKGEQFTQIIGKSPEEIMKIKTPNELMEQSVICFGLATVVATVAGSVFAGAVIVDKNSYCDLYLASMGALFSVFSFSCGFAMDYCLYSDFLEGKNPDEICQKYGFESVEDFRQAATQIVYSYVTSEEAKQINGEILAQKLDVLATQNGYENAEAMMQDLKDHSTVQTLSSSQRLQMLAEERYVTNDNFAKENGFKSYEDVLLFLNNHKILVEETEKSGFDYSSWSEYDYDSASAKILAQKLSNLDDLYDAKKQVIIDGGAYSKTTVFDNSELANQVASFESIVETANKAIENGGIYSNNERFFYASNEVVPVWDNWENPWEAFWVDNSYGKGKLLADGLSASEMIQRVKDGEIETVGSSVENSLVDLGEKAFDVSIGLGTIVGTTLGVGAGTTLKFAPQIINRFKLRNAEKTACEIKKVEAEKQTFVKAKEDKKL